MKLELADCTKSLLREIALGMTQRQVAMTYRLAMLSSEATDWEVVNRAIIERWSFSGLERIKKMAHSGKF